MQAGGPEIPVFLGYILNSRPVCDVWTSVSKNSVSKKHEQIKTWPTLHDFRVTGINSNTDSKGTHFKLVPLIKVLVEWNICLGNCEDHMARIELMGKPQVYSRKNSDKTHPVVHGFQRPLKLTLKYIQNCMVLRAWNTCQNKSRSLLRVDKGSS